MSHITLDEPILTKLRSLTEPVEFRDQDGQVIGLFTPERSPEEAARYERVKQLFDLEKAKRVAETERGQGKTTAEVLEGLRAAGPGR